jgi:thiol-disulfide isomerase/thioredoxin
MVGAAIVAVIALAAIVAIAVSGGDSSTGQAAAGAEQYRPVTVTGSALAPLDQSAAVDPAIGTIAPSLSGQSFDGTAVSYTPGRPTLLVFLAHWCIHCRAEVPVLVDWQAAGKAPAGVDVIGVATGTDSTKPNFPPSAWLSGAGFPWPMMADSTSYDAAMAYGLTSFPYFVLVDAQGAVVARASGELTPTALDALVAQVAR